MIFIIGGRGQGKLQFAKELLRVGEESIIDGGSCVLEQAFSKPVLNKLHLLVYRLLEANIDAEEFIRTGINKKPPLALICDELGTGVIPMEKKERIFQEQLGRIQCQLAQEAEKVYRIYCSIPQLLKG
ncbi:MAG: bifunctional adenosylcobinamide kinase/adenosylcobinamide-phosphate guanylyltransferase [Desulfitobacteriia bacterium]|jgi:adenosylcobinamide kinase/adenosylcobinamide-phosphate guanylyltransferase